MSLVSNMVEHTSLKHANLINKIAAPLQEHFGISYFCYQFVSHEGHWFTLGNHPEWLLYSAKNEFYRVDPSLVCTNRYKAGSFFIQAHQHEEFQQSLVSHAVEKFKLDHGLMLVKPGLMGCEHFFFAAPREHLNILNIYLSQFSRLNQDYVDHVREQVKPIHHQLLESSVDLKEVNTERFYSTDYLLKMDDDLSRGLGFISDIRKIPTLTARENQCLILYRQGFTAKQTAKQLGLSFRTIEDHFEKIKLKCGVQSKQELLFRP